MGGEACERNGGWKERHVREMERWEERHFPLVSGACNVKEAGGRGEREGREGGEGGGERGRGGGGERGALYWTLRGLERVGGWRKRFVGSY